MVDFLDMDMDMGAFPEDMDMEAILADLADCRTEEAISPTAATDSAILRMDSENEFS